MISFAMFSIENAILSHSQLRERCQHVLERVKSSPVENAFVLSGQSRV
jgi:hypothetical protein